MTGTPGPWAVCLDSEPMDQDGIVCCGGNELEIRPAAGQKLGDEAADFRLMAAAPELLNAVRFLLSNPDNRISKADRDAAYAAIFKATGGAA